MKNETEPTFGDSSPGICAGGWSRMAFV